MERIKSPNNIDLISHEDYNWEIFETPFGEEYQMRIWNHDGENITLHYSVHEQSLWINGVSFSVKFKDAYKFVDAILNADTTGKLKLRPLFRSKKYNRKQKLNNIE